MSPISKRGLADPSRLSQPSRFTACRSAATSISLVDTIDAVDDVALLPAGPEGAEVLDTVV